MQSALDVVVSGKHRQLSTTVIMPLIIPRECEDNMSMGDDGWNMTPGHKEEKKMSQGGKGGGEGGIQDRSCTQG